MGKPLTNRLDEILEFLWERGGGGATAAEIRDHLMLTSERYAATLVRKMMQVDNVVRQRDIFIRKYRYFAAHSSVHLIPKNASPTPAYFPIDNWNFQDDRCFLCGSILDDQNRTIEHIFPKWLQKRYNLYNEELTLQNSTHISYRNLVVPCCKTCNGNYLSPLEKAIQTAHDRGVKEFRKIPTIRIFQWLAKIYYGILFRELSLLKNRSDASHGYIFNDKQIKSFRTLHHFLQSVRLPFVFRGFQPWSIFILDCLKFGDDRDFDYKDLITTPLFGIRMGEIGVFVCLEDVGIIQERLKEFMQEISELRLHPIQFDEIFAHIYYNTQLINRVPTYLTNIPKSSSNVTTAVIMMGVSKRPLFREWNSEEYAQILHSCWLKYEIQFSDIYSPPDSVLTMLRNDADEFLQLDIDGQIAQLIPSGKKG
jgi:hypothetical protein